MKLKHRITGTILAIAFATTSALPAATIPQIKNPPKAVAKVPSAPAAPRIPVAPRIVNIPKAPSAVKVPAVKVPAVKVPAIAKIPAVKTPVAPKVPVITKIPGIKVPSVPKTVATPAVKVPATVRFAKAPATTVKTTVATKAPALAKGIANAPAANINTGKLKNLKERLPVEMKAVETRFVVADGVRTQVGGSGKGDRFMNDNFGGARSSQPGTFMEGVRSKSGGHDKNPLSSIPAGGGMVTTRGAAASQDAGGENPGAAEDTSVVDAAINWVMSVIGTGVGGPGTQSGAGTAASGTAGSFASTAFSILTANTGSVDDKKNEAEGIFGIFRLGKRGTSNGNVSAQLDQTDLEPVPDDVGSSGSGIVTKGDIKGLEARKNQHSQPTGEESGAGGHVNTGANGAGKLGSLAQPAGDEVRSAVRVTGEDMRAMQVRINARINTGGR